MTAECAFFLSSLKVPDLDCTIIGASCEDVIIKLETHDTIPMTFESFHRATTILPVATDFKTVFVHVFPWPEFRPDIRVFRVFPLQGPARPLARCLGRC